MKGLTNVWLAGDVYGEKVYITLQTNQSSHEDIVGAVVTVGYDDVLEEYVWDGQTFSVVVPPGRECTVSFSAVEGYQSPDSVVFDAVDDNSREVSVQYRTEVLTVNVTSDEGSVSGYTVEVGTLVTFGSNDEYIQLEYAESDGNQYIDTGVYPNGNTMVEITFQSTATTGSCAICGETAWKSTTFGIWTHACGYGTTGTTSVVFYGDDPVTAVLSKNVLYKNGVVVWETTSQEFESPYTMYLCAGNKADRKIEGFIGKVYSCKIYDNESLVRDYVPVKSKTGEIGFYDKLNGTFQISIGTDDFMAGDFSINEVIDPEGITGLYKIPYGNDYSVKANDVEGYFTPSVERFVASLPSRVVTMLYTVDAGKDLSMYDIYGNEISQTTANCYVINEPGTYKFPLVFGNAIKNGAENSAAYTKNSGTLSHDFVDYNGSVISSPYIETTSGTASFVQLSIADTDGVFAGLNIIPGTSCRYVQFNVGMVPDTGANGVISIKDSSGIVMWSWHIWVWPDDLSPVTITNETGYEYDILPVNLASKWDDGFKTKKNWFYQFGRSAPLLCPASGGSTSGDFHESFGVLSYTAESIASGLHVGIQNPTAFYKGDWWYEDGDTYNLWDASCDDSGCSDNDVIKTIYDPSPIGYHIPNGNTFSAFESSAVITSTTGGMYLKRNDSDTTGILFSSTGCIDAVKGTIFGCSAYGYVWTSALNSPVKSYNVESIYPASISPNDVSYQAYGYSVRPVAE